MDEWVVAITAWVIALAGSPWVFVALYAFATIDGFFPPVPSETVVIALAALSISTGEPNFWVLGAVAAAGAFTGDQIAYSIGKRIPVRTLRFMQGPKSQRAVDWAERALAERGATFIIAARYVPIGRVAVNMTAGTVRFSRRRFSLLAAIAAVMWSIYSVMLGIGAGVWLGENPLLAVTVGVVGGMLIGVVVDWAIKQFVRSRRGRRGVTRTTSTVDGPGAVTTARSMASASRPTEAASRPTEAAARPTEAAESGPTG